MLKKIIWLLPLTFVLFFSTCMFDVDGRGGVTVTFNANDATGTPPPAQTGRIGSSITLPNVGSLSKGADYIFSGWNTNAMGTGINYPAGESFILPSTNITLYANWSNTAARIPKTHIERFSSSRSYSFNMGFPATVEIYAGGAGGGGAGGHWVQGGLGQNDLYSTGGAGGGGAVEYREFEITASTTFSVTLGTGGAGGSGETKRYFGGGPETGATGNDGSNTIVNWNGGTLSAQGGKGGWAQIGGAGGTMITRGANGIEGNNGITHSRTQTGRSTGGAGGSYGDVRGGNGGYGGGGINAAPEAGGRGEAGSVVIVFTWYE
jgi:hypothetical protein